MKKRALTLIEVMIVILIISLIGGAIGYNMKGALGKGKVFRTEQGIELLHDQLLLCLDEGGTATEIAQDPVPYLKKLGLAKDPKKLILDGWNQEYNIAVSGDGKDFVITSDNLKPAKK